MFFRSTRLIGCLAIAMITLVDASAAELRVIEHEAEPRIQGKEVDWIYGDYLMENDRISLVIAAPLPTRDANLTVRNIGASILDLTLKNPSNDQLSALIIEPFLATTDDLRHLLG